jgi:hypothetical protein
VQIIAKIWNWSTEKRGIRVDDEDSSGVGGVEGGGAERGQHRKGFLFNEHRSDRAVGGVRWSTRESE